MTTRYSHNKNYFTVPNVENSYWAGFLAADGCITHDRKRPKLSIGLSRKDDDHLELFKGAIQYTGMVKYYTAKCDNKVYPTAHLALCGVDQVASDLKQNFCITPRKSLTLQPPLQLDNLRHIIAFIAGYIDGDGSIYTPSDRHCDTSISLVGTKDILQWIAGYVDVLCPSSYHSNTPSAKPKACSKSRAWTYAFGGNRAINFYHLAQQLSLPWLTRKWQQLEKFSSLNERYLRPWGIIDVIESTSDYHVRILKIAPGQCTSIQRHSRRNEMVILLDGEIEINHNDYKFTRNNDNRASGYRFPARDWHGLSCFSQETWATVLEVAYGELIHDDFEIKEDKYDRERKRGPGFIVEGVMNDTDWRKL